MGTDWCLPVMVFFLRSPGPRQVKLVSVRGKIFLSEKYNILRSGEGCYAPQREFPSVVGAHAAEWEDSDGTK